MITTHLHCSTHAPPSLPLLQACKFPPPKLSSPSPRRAFLLLLPACLSAASPSPPLLAQPPPLRSEDWYRFQGNGFALSVPPDFEDIMPPEDYTAGLSLYGERAKEKPFAARFASSDRSEVLSVVIRQASQLKLTFFATKDITDLGSLRDAASIFVPVGAKLYVARTIKEADADAESDRTYYYYEFSTAENYVAMEAAASSGKVFVVGVTAPKLKWMDDGRKLRLAASSFSLL